MIIDLQFRIEKPSRREKARERDVPRRSGGNRRANRATTHGFIITTLAIGRESTLSSQFAWAMFTRACGRMTKVRSPLPFPSPGYFFHQLVMCTQISSRTTVNILKVQNWIAKAWYSSAQVGCWQNRPPTQRIKTMLQPRCRRLGSD